MTYISGGTLEGLLRLTAPATTPALSIAGEGRLYFDGTQFLASQNGAAYAALSGGGGGGWTDDGTVVRLTTVGDGVGIGTAAPAAGSKLEVLGDATRLNILATGGNPGGAGTGGAITLVGGLGGTTGVGGAVSVTSGAGGTAGDGSSGAVTIASGTSPFGATTGSTTGDLTIQTGAFTGTTTDQGDATGTIAIRVGGGVDLVGDNGLGGSVVITAGSTDGSSCTAGGLTLSAGTANVGVSTGGSVNISAGGGYTAGDLSISAQIPGPGGGGEITMSSGANLSISGGPDGIVGIAASGPAAAIQLAYADATPWTALTLDTAGVTATFPGGGVFTVDGDLTVTGVFTQDNGAATNFTVGNSTTAPGLIQMSGPSMLITPNTGTLLQMGPIYYDPANGQLFRAGNSILIDGDGVDNWIYGDDAAVAATPGEPLTLRGGAGNTTGVGGELRLRGGAGGATGNGSAVVVTGGAGGATSGAAGGASISGGVPVDGNGGSVSLIGSAGVGTNRDGGSVTLQAGVATGSGTAGSLIFNTNGATERARVTSAGRLGVGTTGPTSTLDADGSVGAGDVASVSTNTTLNDTHSVVLVDATGGTVTITLPAVTGLVRRRYTIKKIDASANTVVIDGNGAETIDGATTQSLVTQYDSMEIVTNGTEWFII